MRKNGFFGKKILLYYSLIYEYSNCYHIHNFIEKYDERVINHKYYGINEWKINFSFDNTLSVHQMLFERFWLKVTNN